MAILGVGSELRGDDAVGMRVARLLSERGDLPNQVQIVLGSTAPESVTGPIREQAPSHLIVLDAADFGAEPGEITWLESSEIGGATFCTHSLPLHIIIDYLRASITDLNCFVLAVQAKDTTFGAPLTFELERAAQQLAAVLANAFKGSSSVDATLPPPSGK